MTTTSTFTFCSAINKLCSLFLFFILAVSVCVAGDGSIVASADKTTLLVTETIAGTITITEPDIPDDNAETRYVGEVKKTGVSVAGKYLPLNPPEGTQPEILSGVTITSSTGFSFSGNEPGTWEETFSISFSIATEEKNPDTGEWEPAGDESLGTPECVITFTVNPITVDISIQGLAEESTSDDNNPDETPNHETDPGAFIAVDKFESFTVSSNAHFGTLTVTATGNGLGLFDTDGNSLGTSTALQLSENNKSFNLKVKGNTVSVNPRDKSLEVVHGSWTEAADEANVTIVSVNIILDGIGEDKEENPGAFLEVGKYKLLQLQVKPVGLKGTLTLVSDLRLYTYSDTYPQGPGNMALTWNLSNNEIPPQNLYVKDSIPSSSLRDKTLMLAYSSPGDYVMITDTIRVTVVSILLTPYTPTTKNIGPMEIPKENFQTNKVGVRLNGDFDNGGSSRDWLISAVVPTENDLIRTDISINPLPVSGGGLKYVLKKTSNNITFWGSNQKGGSSYSIPSNGKSIVTSGTLWAEWSQNVHGTCNFSLEVLEEQSGKVIAKKEFDYRSFKSVTDVFVGEFQTPGNETVSPGLNNWVIEELLNGYDIHVFDDGFDLAFSGDCNKFGEGAAFDEICNAVNYRGIDNVAAIGYSHGGGSVYNLSWRMFYDGGTSDNWEYWYPPQKINNTYNLIFTSYLDAVTNSDSTNLFAEERRPLNSDYHTNQYQRLIITSFRGTSSGGDEDHDRTYLGVGHGTFSNNPVIRNHLRMWYESKVLR